MRGRARSAGLRMPLKAGDRATRIVLADEEVMLRQALKPLLERQGCAILAEASDGCEAVELVRKHRPDVAVLDMGMLRMNGLQAAQVLERTCPAVRVILLRLRHNDRHVLEALQHGVRGFV